jgi:hypothetical protein
MRKYKKEEGKVCLLIRGVVGSSPIRGARLSFL